MRKFFSIFLVVLVGSQAKSFVGSVSAASGGAGTAVVEASDSPFMNPASIAHLLGYYFTSSFGSSRQGGLGAGQDLAVSLTDNMRETIVPTSLAYAQQYFDTPDDQDFSSRMIRLGFANYVAKNVSLGFGLSHREDRTVDKKYSQGNLDLGILWAPNSNVGLGIEYENVLGGRIEVPDRFREDSKLAAGITLNYKKFYRVKADLQSAANNNFQRPTLKLGVETYLNNWIVARFGGQRNNQEEYNVYTGGFGFIGPKFGLHYAYQSSPQEESITRHSVDLALPLW